MRLRDGAEGGDNALEVLSDMSEVVDFPCSDMVADEQGRAYIGDTDIAPDGSLSNRRAWALFEDQISFSQGRITPDGICLDAEGAIWLASPGTREVLRVREGAEVTHRIPLDAIPVACMLGGPQRRTLFISATESLDPRDSSARGLIEIVQVDAPGAGLP